MHIKDIAAYIAEKYGEEDVRRIECFIVLTAYLHMKKIKKPLFEEDIYLFNKENNIGFHIPVLRSGPKSFRLTGEKKNISQNVGEMIDDVMHLFGDMTTNRLQSHILRYKEISQQITNSCNEETLLHLPLNTEQKEN